MTASTQLNWEVAGAVVNIQKTQIIGYHIARILTCLYQILICIATKTALTRVTSLHQQCVSIGIVTQLTVSQTM